MPIDDSAQRLTLATSARHLGGCGPLLFPLLIFVLEVVYVTIMTCRWIILVKGYRWVASAVALFEQVLYVFALTLVVVHLSDPIRLVAYAAGYAVGTLVGSWAEDRIAVGYVAFHIVTSHAGLAESLRERGVAVTSWTGYGRDAAREVLFAVVRRKSVATMMNDIGQMDPEAFVTRTELQSLVGGYLVGMKR